MAWHLAQNIRGRQWRKRLQLIFDAAGIANAHPHRFRDTFECELLLAGMPIERVAKVLGHKSTRITEKHYSAWVMDRQRQLEEDVRRTWAFARTRNEADI